MDAIAWIAGAADPRAMDQGFFDHSPLPRPPGRSRGERIHRPRAAHGVQGSLSDDAGCLPPEVELRREVASPSELLDTIAEGPERQRIRRELFDRRLRLELFRRHR